MSEEIIKNDGMTEVIGIRFKEGGKVYYFEPRGNVARDGDYAVVETARGMEFGKVSLLSGVICLALMVALEFVILREEKF